MGRDTKYAVRMPGFFGEEDPQEIGDYIDALIDEQNEALGPDELLAAARKRESPLHSLVEWKDEIAGEKWRRKQIKNLMNSLMVAKHGKPTRTRAFVYIAHPEHDGKHVYIAHRSAMARPELKAQVVEMAVRSAQRWLNFYGPTLGMRRGLAKDIERLRRRLERELMAMI